MSISKFISNLLRWVKSLFQKLPYDTQTAIDMAVRIVERLKSCIDSPVADLVTAIIPGRADDVAILTLRKALPKLLEQLQLTKNCINGDDNATLHCALQTLGSINKPTRNSFYHSISVLLAQVLTDEKLTWHDGVLLLEWYYSQQLKQQNMQP